MNKDNRVSIDSECKEGVSLVQAVLLVVGIVIGSGVFFKPSVIFGNAGAPGMGILAWIVGASITMAGALTIAEIASVIPKSGGMFVYLKELYGERIAFLYGWVQAVIYYPGMIAAVAMIFAIQSTSFIDISPTDQKLLAVGVIIFITVVNILSTEFGTKCNTLFAIGKLVPIGLIIVFGLLKGDVHSFTPVISENTTVAGFGAALLGVLFAYEGWVSVANIAGEMENPSKNLPKAIVLGLTISTIVYVGINLALVNTISVDQIVASAKPASEAAIVLFGPTGEKIVATGILVSLVGCLSAVIMTGARMPQAMAEDKLFPFKNFFGKINEKRNTPSNALIFQGVVACSYALSGSFNTVADLAVFVIWLFFILGIGGVFKLRKDFKHIIKKDSYKVPLYPVVPIVGILGATYVVVSTIITSTTTALIAIGITAIGLPVYSYIKKKNIVKTEEKMAI
ncbi:APC family permease [Clostridium frigidicarnis]|uniref:Serine/threonine exchange transporter, LAT family n=1 Tax=Clostridium frigidicarnis TaxID=84698 RepID=A0A1I0YGP1_9CLOT|nr:amino acid permease [Clostridium frigidicarnis]SFB12381.1 serine/threonine exchange transporter, LAT family [Clostridium frigidicarnis]